MDTSEQDGKALEYITAYTAERGRPPTNREVGRALGMDHPNNASRVVARLVAAGKLAKDGGAARGLRLLAPPGLSIPLRGRVSCGPPREGDEDGGERIDFHRLFGREDLVGFVAHGESMREAAIRPGDWLIVRECPDPEPGRTVIAMVNRDMVCKRYYPDGDVVRLVPCNDSVATIEVPLGGETYFRVLGVLHSVVRKV